MVLSRSRRPLPRLVHRLAVTIPHVARKIPAPFPSADVTSPHRIPEPSLNARSGVGEFSRAYAGVRPVSRSGAMTALVVGVAGIAARSRYGGEIDTGRRRSDLARLGIVSRASRLPHGGVPIIVHIQNPLSRVGGGRYIRYGHVIRKLATRRFPTRACAKYDGRNGGPSSASRFPAVHPAPSSPACAAKIEV